MNLRRISWIVLFAVLAGSLVASGEPVDAAAAKDVATAFVSAGLARGEIYRAAMRIPPDVAVDGVRVLTDGASQGGLAYVFELEPTGYIVVTPDTRLEPIVAYSFACPFPWEESTENVLLDMLRQDMANRLRAVEDGRIEFDMASTNERSWDEYREETRPPDPAAYETGVYGPWTLSPWSQGAPYNADCPLDPVTSSRCVVGCVATALAQILNYWQTPTSVTFQTSDNYTSTVDPDGVPGNADDRVIPITATTANFSGLTYNGCSPSDAAKADLSFAAGVSVRMNYSSIGSGATTAKVAPALAGSGYPWAGAPPQRWGYHSADVRAYNSTYSYWGSPYYVSQTTFFNDLKANMMQARPAQMAIQKSSTGGGHSIVVDGYHPTANDYHLNYGWGTSSYGWYSLPSGLPSGYDIIKYAVYNIVPTTSTYTLSTSTGGTGSGTVQALPGAGALTRGTHVLVSASAAPGSSFSHWTGALSGSENPAMVILDGNKTVNAVFDAGGGPVSSKRWTVMVYLAADNNLGGGTPSDPDFMDFDEMETALVSSGSDLDVVVLWDKPGTNDTYIYWVQPNGTEGSLATYTLGVNRWTLPGVSEANMGAQATLTNFMDWVFANFDSTYYGLILWNHGGGWAPKSETFGEPTRVPSTYVSLDAGTLTDVLLEGNDTVWPLPGVEKAPEDGSSPRAPLEPLEFGICWDDTDGGDYLTTKEAAYGIDGSTREYVDNLGLDACLMQMLEVAYEFRVTPSVAADYLTASQASEWGYGWAYHQILSTITATTTPLQLAQLWWATRSIRHAAGGLDTISSVNLWQIDDLAAEVSALADRLVTLVGDASEYQRILYSKLLAEWFYYTDSCYMDLGDFCGWLDTWLLDATARTLAQAVVSRLSSAVVAMANGTAFSTFGTATGLSIYLPHYHDIFWSDIYGGPSLSQYNATNLAFCAHHTWDEFVAAWLAADHPDPYEPNNTPAAAYDRGTAHSNDVTYLCREADFDDGTEDWYKMTIPFWFDLDVWVWCTEYTSDTMLYAYSSLSDAQSDNYFDVDDDGMRSLGYESYGSRIQRFDLRPGTYYFKVGPWSTYDPDEDYEIWIRVTRGAAGPASFRVDSDGYVYLDGTLWSAALASGSADVAEWVNVSEPVEPGDVLELDPLVPGAYRRARGPCSPYVAGVVSTDPGVVLGARAEGARAVLALAGFVPVKACDEGGPIDPGDLLVTATRSGYVRRGNSEDCGFIVGKALEPLHGSEGLILVLLAR